MWPKGGDKSTRISTSFRDEGGKAVLDALLVCILAGIVIGIIFPHYHRMVQEAKEVALRAGLVNIRKTIQLYHFTNHQYPPNLESLVRKRLMVPARGDTFFKEEYLSAMTTDSEGHLLDSFGNRYQYDPGSGRVSSGTQGYETW